MVVIGESWDASSVDKNLISNVMDVWSYVSSQEGFTTAFIVRKDAPPIDLARTAGRIKEPADFLMGAKSLRNVTFTKNDGNFQGTLVLYKDKIVFVSSAVYVVKSYEEGHKAQELAKVNVDLRTKAGHLGYAGDPDNFYVWKPYPPTKDNVSSFLNEVKDAFKNDKLRLRV